MSQVTRIAYLAVGLVFTGLGVVGAFLPVLPTTPLLLIALWAFSRSSVRLQTWLLEHQRFGPHLRAWRAHRVIPLPVKLTAFTSMIASLTLMTIVGVAPAAIIASAAIMTIGAVYVATRPSTPALPPATDSAIHATDATAAHNAPSAADTRQPP